HRRADLPGRPRERARHHGRGYRCRHVAGADEPRARGARAGPVAEARLATAQRARPAAGKGDHAPAWRRTGAEERGRYRHTHDNHFPPRTAGFRRAALRRLRTDPANSSLAVDRVQPAHLFRLFDRLDVEVDDDCLVITAHQHAFQRLIARSVDLLMRHIGRHENEIARSGLGDIFEMVAPAHPRPAPDDINDAFEGAVVVCAGFRIGVDMNGAGPDLLRPDTSKIDGGGAV